MKNIACAELLAFLLVNWPFLGVEKRSLAQNVQEEQTFPTHPDPKRWDENWASYGCSKSRRWQVRGYWGVGWSSSCSRFALRAKLVCRASSNSPITSHLSPKALIVIDWLINWTANLSLLLSHWSWSVQWSSGLSNFHLYHQWLGFDHRWLLMQKHPILQLTCCGKASTDFVCGESIGFLHNHRKWPDLSLCWIQLHPQFQWENLASHIGFLILAIILFCFLLHGHPQPKS